MSHEKCKNAASNTPCKGLPVHSNTDDDFEITFKPLEKMQHEKIAKLSDFKLVRASETQFDKLTFSSDAEFLHEIQQEIKEDIDEFVNCMKNSIFFGSGIQRFYNSELDKFRRRFIELEHNKQRWQFYVFKYIKLNSPKVKIPAPKLADEIEKRSKMVKSVKEIFSIIDAF